MFISFALIFFLLVGVVGAVDTTNVSITEDSNLDDNVDTLSAQNKLEISNGDSISETNIVNSHDDNLENSPDTVLSSSITSDYENDSRNVEPSLAAFDDDVVVASSSNNSAVPVSSGSNVLSVSSQDSNLVAAKAKVATSLTVANAYYNKTSTIFKVTLVDKSNKVIAGQTISFKVNGVTYSAKTTKYGNAYVFAKSLAVGTYTVSISYAGTSSYAPSSLSKKVNVLSTVNGSDLTKYWGYTSVYQAAFFKEGAPLANTQISFKINNGKTYKVSTNKDGIAKLNINLAVGKYVISSTNPYSLETLSNNIIVKKDSTVISGAEKTYVLTNNAYVYTVTLKSAHNTTIQNAEITFTYNNKKVTAKTDVNGKANITIPVLPKGTYNITYKFDGSTRVLGSSGSGILKVQDPIYHFTVSKLKWSYKDGSVFSVKLLDKNEKAVAHKYVKIVIDGKVYTDKTNGRGWAYFNLDNLKPGVYKIKTKYSSLGLEDYSVAVNKLTISKLPSYITTTNLKMNYNDGTSYKVIVKDKSGKALKNVVVKYTISGKSYTLKTNSKGVASLLIKLKVGYYPINTVVSDDYYTSSSVSKHILVNGTKFVASEVYISIGSKLTYAVKAIDGLSKPIKNAKITFTVAGKTYTAKTASTGIAKVEISGLSKGDHTIKFTHGNYSGSSTIHVVNQVTIKQLITASKYVKNYVEDKNALPSTVKIGDLTVSTPEFTYLVSKAIINLKSGKTTNIPIKLVKKANNAGSAEDLGILEDYLSVAKSVVNYADSKGVMPDSVNSKVGTIGYKGLVYAFARIVAFYGDHDNTMPSYVTISSLSDSSLTSKLNSKNTITNLAAYLAASTNCQVNNAKIKALVSRLTNGLTSNKDKAAAIFNYVRDTISYSFYYDTRYGAVDTLEAGTGNCVDHSHLLVAMYRAAGLPARYVHGTCTFSSGSTYGHVWTQVLIGNTWVVSDATSTRNSFGNVVNWNADSYSLHGYYADLQF